MRLDHYQKTRNNNIHMANILYSFAVLGALVMALSCILKCKLEKDFRSLELATNVRRERRQERLSGTQEEHEGLTSNRTRSPIRQNDVMWKKLQGDVFRKPAYPTLLAVFLGCGVQLLTWLVTYLFAMVIFSVNTYFRFYVVYNSIMILVGGGISNGYVSARAMRWFGGTEWRVSAICSCLFLPTLLLAFFLTVDTIDWMEKSWSALPVSSFVLYIFLWIFLHVPACYWGAYMGMNEANDKPPLKVSNIRRVIPPIPWYLNSVYGSLLGGFVIFSTVMFEFHYVLTSVWRSYLPGAFIFALVNVSVLSCITLLVSVLMTYYRLQAGNWKW